MPRSRSKLMGLTLLMVLCAAAASPVVTRAETPAERDARLAWWRDAKFGMFIHWGVYAVPAGTYEGNQIGGIGEWIMQRAKIPVPTYKAFARGFNPVKYDPEKWARLAEEAGMKYVVITSKHHDGFALYDSAVTDWDVADATPYGKDLLAPLAKAARDRGLKFGLYYSQAQDWTHAGGGKAGYSEGEGWDAAHRGSFDEYLTKIAVPQTREVLERYNPDVLWWDTPVWMTTERARPLNELLALRPGIVTNNRLGGGYQGDTETPEQFIPATGIAGRDWETCMTMNDTWGYKSYDENWKSSRTLIRNLVDVVAKGGNYLLNVGPTAEGEIPTPSIERLRAVGAWMRVNGQAIYGTTASPCRMPEWGRLTRRGDRLYLHVFTWPSDGRLTVPLHARVTGARLLADTARSVTTNDTEAGLAVTLPGEAPDADCSVVELTITGEPEPVLLIARQDDDGVITLAVTAATLNGKQQVEEIGGAPNLGYWTSPGDTAAWRLRVTQDGMFRVSAEVAAPDASRLGVSVGDQSHDAEVAETGGYQHFKRVDLGTFQLARGDHELTLRPDAKRWRPINLRDVTLTPVDESSR